MTIEEAIIILETHNQWRKGADIEMETPINLSVAIDLIVCEVKEYQKIKK